MKLESKLGISTGVLILAMFASALVAHIRVQEANRLAELRCRRSDPHHLQGPRGPRRHDDQRTLA